MPMSWLHRCRARRRRCIFGLDSFKRIDVVREANVREISESTVDKFLRKLQKNDLIVSEGNGYYRKTERGKQVVEI